MHGDIEHDVSSVPIQLWILNSVMPVMPWRSFERPANEKCNLTSHPHCPGWKFQPFFASPIHTQTQKFEPRSRHATSRHVTPPPPLPGALQQTPSADYDEDIVCQVFQEGYMIGEKLVRPAIVAVSIGS